MNKYVELTYPLFNLLSRLNSLNYEENITKENLQNKILEILIILTFLPEGRVVFKKYSTRITILLLNILKDNKTPIINKGYY